MYVTTLYEKILDDALEGFCETSSKMYCLTERHVQAIWLEQRYFRGLKTHDGKAIEVISPGIWNAEAGPDFLKAHLCIDGEDVLGDVEIHLSDGAWRQHRHGEDSRYDRVALHVSFWQSSKECDVVTSKGTSIVRTYLEPNLTIPVKRILQLIDLDLYPYRKFVGSGKCAQALFIRSSLDKTKDILSSAAMWRLERKRISLLGGFRDESEALICGMAMVMGYRFNALVFENLYIWLKQQAVNDFDLLLSLALGVTNFFDEPFVTRWQKSPEYRRLLALWQANPRSERFVLQLGRTRPLNHPIRRLVALCMMTLDSQLDGLLDRCINVWKTRWHTCRRVRDFTLLREGLADFLPSYQHEYWSKYYLFEDKPASEGLSLLGQDFKHLTLVNIFLPFLHGRVCAEGNEGEIEAFENFYATFRAPLSGKQKYLTHRLFGEMPNGKLLRKSLYEQGAFQIHSNFCVHFEASCEGCPFVERVKATYGTIR